MHFLLSFLLRSCSVSCVGGYYLRKFRSASVSLSAGSPSIRRSAPFFDYPTQSAQEFLFSRFVHHESHPEKEKSRHLHLIFYSYSFKHPEMTFFLHFFCIHSDFADCGLDIAKSLPTVAIKGGPGATTFSPHSWSRLAFPSSLLSFTYCWGEGCSLFHP